MTPKYHISNGLTSFLTRVSSPENGANLGIVLGKGYIDAAARHDHQNDRTCRGLRHSVDELSLETREEEIIPIQFLPLHLEAQPCDYDGRLGLLCSFHGRADGAAASAMDVTALMVVHSDILGNGIQWRDVSTRYTCNGEPDQTPEISLTVVDG